MAANTLYNITYSVINLAHPNVLYTVNSNTFIFNASQSYTFNYSSTQISTSTVYFYIDGLLVYSNASGGNLTFSWTTSILAGSVFTSQILKGSGNSPGGGSFLNLGIVSS